MTLNERIVELCKIQGISQSELERRVGIAKGSVTKWKSQEPKFSSLEKIAEFLGVSTDYLLYGKESDNYYLNNETKEIAQEIFENKELRLLFDASRDATPEDLKTIHEMLLALKRKERGNQDDL